MVRIAGPNDSGRATSNRLSFVLESGQTDLDDGTHSATLPTAAESDTPAPFYYALAGRTQLWSLRDPFGPAPAGSSVIAAHCPVPWADACMVALIRPPGSEPFTLDDLVYLGERLEAGASIGLADSPVPPARDHPTTAGDGQALDPGPVFEAGLTPIDRLLSGSLLTDSPHEVARRLVRLGQTSFSAEGCVLYVPVGASDAEIRGPIRAGLRLDLVAAVGSGILLTPPWLPPPGPDVPSPFAAGPDGPVLACDIDHAALIEREQAEGTRLSAMPMRWEGRLVAILGIRHRASLSLFPVDLITQNTSIGAMAMEVARQRQDAQVSYLAVRSELARARLAHDAATTLLGAPDIHAALAAHARLLVPAIADGYLIYLDRNRLPAGTSAEDAAPGSAMVRVAAHWHGPGPHLEIRSFGSWFASRRSQLIPDHLDDGHGTTARLTVPDPGSNLRFRSVVSVPLLDKGTLIGWLLLVTTERGRRDGRHDLAFIDSLTAPLVRALSAQRLLATPDAEPDGTGEVDGRTGAGPGDRLLAAVAVGLLALDDPDEIVRTASHLIATHLASWSAIELPITSRDGAQLAVIAGVEKDRPAFAAAWRTTARDAAQQRGPARVLSSGQPELIPNLQVATNGNEWVRAAGSLYADLRPVSVVSVPIPGPEAPLGVITCLRSSPDRTFDLATLSLVEEVAALVARALEHAEQLRAERARSDQLAMDVSRYARLLASMADGLLILDPSGTIEYANEAARAMHGGDNLAGPITEYVRQYVNGDINGAPIYDGAFPVMAPLTTGRPVRMGWQIIRKDGSTVSVLGISTPIHDDEDTPLGCALSLHDITTETQLDLRRQQFMLALSHDLKSPLTSIKGWAQYLGQRGNDQLELDRAVELRAFDAIVKQTRALQRLIDRFVAASRREMDHAIALNLQQVDLIDLTRRIVRIYQGLTRRHRIVVDHGSLERIDGFWDPDALDRIIGNLLSNAIKYSPAGGDIRIVLASDGESARLSVIDNGIGIPATQLSEIFDQYYRGQELQDDEIIEGVEPSQGLGLFSARQQAQRMRGDVDVTSTVGQGSTFTLRLPIDPFAPVVAE
jgi:signal transduction histidine kinase